MKDDCPAVHGLGVVVGEHHALARDAIDVGRLVADDPERVRAEVSLADIVAKDDEDVRPLGAGLRLGRGTAACVPSISTATTATPSASALTEFRTRIADLLTIACDAPTAPDA